jgi:PAS domain S-box-containing protein
MFSLSNLFSALSIGYFVHDLRNVLQASENISEFYSNTSSFESFISSVHPSDRLLVERQLCQVRKSSDSYRYYCRNLVGTLFEHQGVRDGQGIYYELIKPIPRTKLQDGLTENLQQYESLFSNLPAVAFRCAADRHWTMEYISPGILKISGYPSKDFIQNSVRPFSSIMHLGDYEQVWTSAMKAVEDMHPLSVQYRILHRDGSIRWFAEHSYPSLQDGELKFHGILFDITSLQKKESLLTTVFDTLDDGALVISTEAKILHWNTSFVQMWGVPLPILQKGDDRKLVAFMEQKLSSSGEFWVQAHRDYGNADYRSNVLLCLEDGRIFERRSKPCVCEGEKLGQVIIYRDLTHHPAFSETQKKIQSETIFPTPSEIFLALPAFYLPQLP